MSKFQLSMDVILLARKLRINERKRKMFGIAAYSWVSYGFQFNYISFILGESCEELLRVREYDVGVYDVPGRVLDVLCASSFRTLSYLLTPWSRVLLEKLTGFQLLKKSPSFMKSECSLPRTQVTVTCLYPEPDRSCLCPHTQIPEDPF
jgi:hypothetical protein